MVGQSRLKRARYLRRQSALLAVLRCWRVSRTITLRQGSLVKNNCSKHFDGTREFLTVQKGQVPIESAGDSEILKPGDSAHYRADVPHAIVNKGRSEAVIFLVDIYRCIGT